ncbi:AMP-binding protein [Conexibacter sp. DBS9H8]|uniref:AMP-binding protein n=1 Tax=Conexibacter sp. DBS9H8 TaxID=2937801 RepID=UPI00200FAF11|nr:AMP-binding protein [Conexibacter sp. DBS9H8]
MELWNFADVWETVAATVPERLALIHGTTRRTWAQLSARADRVGRGLVGAGLGPQDKVSLLLYNGPEYIETAFAALKCALVPVNTNYRYGPDELVYLWSDADTAAVVFSGALTESVAAARNHLPDIRLWIHVDDGSHPRPSWAADYEQLASGRDTDSAPLAGGAATDPRRQRSGDDLILIYTGGTTGRPKGVMWRQHDLYRVSDTARDPAEADLDRVRQRLLEQRPAPPVGLPAAPLMHGTGFVFAGTILSRGGTLVTLTSRSFVVSELLDTIDRERVTALCIVGDAFCLPIVNALDAEPERWDISSLTAVSSAGMVWSAQNKERLLVHAPDALLLDTLNSSEASGMGRSITSRQRPAGQTRFRLGENAFVIGDDGRELAPGSGQVGRLAVRGHLPLGYYKDPVKTAEVFTEIRGRRCSIPGDYATVELDGTITLLGRGSTSINTAGEKVYPEEVEAVLRGHPDVVDALVIGVPDERFGEVVVAAVQTVPGAAIDAAMLIAHTRDRLAGYKTPRHVMLVGSVERGPSGKADYPAVRRRLLEWMRQPQPANAGDRR